MAITATPVVNNANYKSWTVEATADGDTTANIAHGMGVAPDLIVLTPMVAAARLSLWVATADATNIAIAKATTGGSGAAGAQLKVVAARPHSIMQ